MLPTGKEFAAATRAFIQYILHCGEFQNALLIARKILKVSSWFINPYLFGNRRSSGFTFSAYQLVIPI